MNPKTYPMDETSTPYPFSKFKCKWSVYYAYRQFYSITSYPYITKTHHLSSDYKHILFSQMPFIRFQEIFLGYLPLQSLITLDVQIHHDKCWWYGTSVYWMDNSLGNFKLYTINHSLCSLFYSWSWDLTHLKELPTCHLAPLYIHTFFSIGFFDGDIKL